ncbi:unnamed protein product [Rotaria magnacalcarata]|uniref:Uncharacterized protein n=1 Tax=Rotaria magnacalcarata TaxID=392030 RepID=A0A815QIS1_9BILA|nr:unnamed protein product [Rotaria magnacalcarata]CAF1585547.1 unnamed protein product [Rotaria magnacalcarata]CAF2031696.1 unnamed protein product [Rotaria magnacalcarata]CAF2059313.1 unnamed protein product [Rotaria magnacalcarata]CAF3773613.1 unnamed protein product [Rotaria magnacalcarata]
MNHANVLLLIVLVLSILGIACIAISIATNAWLRIDPIIGSINESTEVGLWKTCSIGNLATDCIDVLMSTPIILVFIGLGLVILGVITTLVVLVFKRLLPIVTIVSVLFFLMAVAFLIAFVAVYWYQILNTLFQQYLTSVIITTTEFSIGYSCALLFVGLGMIILSISIASFVAGNHVSVSTTKSTYHYPMGLDVAQHYSYF